MAEAAVAALATRSLDDQLAELVADSDLAAPGLVPDRLDDVRLLSFESAGVSVELQFTPTGNGFAMRGLVQG